MEFFKKLFSNFDEKNKKNDGYNVGNLKEIIKQRRENEFKKNIDDVFNIIKNYSEYSLDLNISKNPLYIESPSFIIIKNKKELILNDLLERLKNEFFISAKVGVEFEFYLYDDEKNREKENKNYNFEAKNILEKIYNSCLEEKILIEKPDKEKGIGQIEIRTIPYTDILKLTSDINKLKEIIKKNTENKGFFANLSAQPFDNDCGSSMQVNISLLDEKGNNLFKRTTVDNEKIESNEMMYSIAGLCSSMNFMMPLFINDKDDLKRYDVERCKELHKLGKYPAPSYVSWGVNNHTTAVRISTPKVINIREYELEDNKNRRIEHRVPSAKADIYLVLIGVISGIIYGLERKVYPDIEKTSSNVFINNESLKKIESNLDKMQLNSLNILKLIYKK